MSFRADSLTSRSPNRERIASVSFTRRLRRDVSVEGLVSRSATELSLTLPIPPSINHQYATVNGRRLLSAHGRSYKALVGQEVLVALSRTPCRRPLLEALRTGEELILSIRFFFTSRLRRDVDGGLKIAQDALCQGLGINDNRIIETHLYKHVDKAAPRMEIRLSVASRG